MKITLEQLLQYFDCSEDHIDRIQVVTGGNDWDNADELAVNSELLTPFLKRIVSNMSCEKSFRNNDHVLRVELA